MINIEEKLVQLAQEYTKTSCIAINKIPQSGSNRQYFRLLFRDNPSLIAVYNGDVRENRAFFTIRIFLVITTLMFLKYFILMKVKSTIY